MLKTFYIIFNLFHPSSLKAENFYHSIILHFTLVTLNKVPVFIPPDLDLRFMVIKD